jgi:hypothetical protein
LAFIVLNLINPLLNKDNYNYGKSLFKVFGKIAKSDPKLTLECLSIIKPILIRNYDDLLIARALKALGEMVKFDPKLAFEGLGLIKPQLKKVDYRV